MNELEAYRRWAHKISPLGETGAASDEVRASINELLLGRLLAQTFVVLLRVDPREGRMAAIERPGAPPQFFFVGHWKRGECGNEVEQAAVRLAHHVRDATPNLGPSLRVRVSVEIDMVG